MGFFPIPGFPGGGFPGGGFPGGGLPGGGFPGGGLPGGGFPGGGLPGGGFPGGGLPGGGFPQQGLQGPTSPPPQFVPQMPITTFAVDPGAIRGCLFRFTYVWLNDGQQFWFYPIFVGPRSVSGFRWFGRFWAYFGIDLTRIQSFTCF